MSGKKDRGSYSEADLTVEHPKDHAAGPTAVAVSMKRALAQMGPKRTAQTLLKLNQAEGFDCMSCAWPDPEVGQGGGDLEDRHDLAGRGDVEPGLPRHAVQPPAEPDDDAP